MKKGLLKLVAFSVLVVSLASCAKAPQAEIDAANVSIEAEKLQVLTVMFLNLSMLLQKH